MFIFNKNYFFFAVLLLLTEIFIAIYIKDTIVRPYGGDFLVVILLYCFIQSFINSPAIITALVVLLFSYIVETLQYFHFIQFIGLADSEIARILIGNSFAWMDMLAYTLGTLTLVIAEKIRIKGQKDGKLNQLIVLLKR
ncbi:DUF2809 domain-containing protein [Rubrolithibacter danxiaensis]|uniref:ribosomal maturation YjgA family protein n=1 Tax=Rubrolithibacter danxiaensis TaxID=3390805 RepID=UPI003BF7DC15